MRICLFDEIQERHVGESLARALRILGHEVICTGPVWKGHIFPSSIEDIEVVKRRLDETISQKPDALVNLRASTLLPDMVQQLKDAGIYSMVWLPDDPVLYSLCYGRIVESYDVALHCGGSQVLSFYTERHGATGINFPFWTDQVAFPYCYRPKRADLDIVFLGSCHGPVRRMRYELIQGLPFKKSIVGRVEDDPAGIHAGYLEDAHQNTKSVWKVLRRAKLGLNIPQIFKDYHGTDYDYPELSSLGSFQYPSRVIQYAAVGLPIVTVGERESLSHFPELVVSDHIEELSDQAADLLAKPERLQELSIQTHRRFQESFSALSRARLIDALLASPGFWKDMNVSERTGIFTQFSGDDDNRLKKRSIFTFWRRKKQQGKTNTKIAEQ